MTATVRVRTPAGPVVGTVRDGVVDFPAVRYADLTDPADRFAEAGPPRRAQAPSPAAFPQLPGALDALLGPALTELPQAPDAFLLRVQAPVDADGLPVLVFLPGGGFLSGSGQARWYDAAQLVRSQRLVLVTVNTRLGALGHLGPDDDPQAGARPVRDLVAAVQWVHRNVAAFGGDPAAVTLAGDSAGAWYARLLSAHPGTAGLVARTALLSMPRIEPLTVQQWHDSRRQLLELLGTDGAGLPGVPVPQLLAAQQQVARTGRQAPYPFRPVVGADVPGGLMSAQRFGPTLHTAALLVLTTTEESAAFLRSRPPGSVTEEAVQEVLREGFADPDAAAALLAHRLPGADPWRRLVETTTVSDFHLPALALAGQVRARMPSHVVRFCVGSPLTQGLSPHCLPLPFLFGPAGWADAPMLAGIAPAVLADAGAVLRGALGQFVHGREAGPLSRYDPAAATVLSIGARGSEQVRVPEQTLVDVGLQR